MVRMLVRACDEDRCRILNGGGLLVDPEHGGEVKRVGAVGEGVFELAVDAEPFQGRRLPPERPVHPEAADRAGFGLVLGSVSPAAKWRPRSRWFGGGGGVVEAR